MSEKISLDSSDLSYICHITRNDHHDRHGHPTLIHEF